VTIPPLLKVLLHKLGVTDGIYAPHVRGRNVSAFIVRSVIHK